MKLFLYDRILGGLEMETINFQGGAFPFNCAKVICGVVNPGKGGGCLECRLRNLQVYKNPQATLL